jgi:hypothetical protein
MDMNEKDYVAINRAKVIRIRAIMREMIDIHFNVKNSQYMEFNGISFKYQQ